MKIFRLFVAFTLICFALSHNAQGVVPPPPGGYPNFTTAAGDHALQALTLGLGNTAIGTFSLFSVTTGNHNTAVGIFALFNNTSGSENIAVGVNAGTSVATANNVICIGAAGADNDNTCYVGNIFGKTVPSGIPVQINSDNLLGTVTSSK